MDSHAHVKLSLGTAAFAEDLNRASKVGRTAAIAARKEYEQGGVPIEYLLACDEEDRKARSPL